MFGVEQAFIATHITVNCWSCAPIIWANFLCQLNLSALLLAQDRLVDEGFNPAYGARPLRRAIMRLLEDSMAERMLAGDIKEGDSVIIDVDADGQISVLNGSTKHTSATSATPAGIA